jgi:hypothetical protein
MRKVLLAVLCFGLLGMSAHSWRCDPSDELANHLFHHEIPSAQYCVVNDTNQKEAIQKLQDHAIIKLTQYAAKDYASPCRMESKRFVYLVRALDVSGYGQFAVYGYHGNLYVTSGVLGTSASPRRTAVVLSTEFAVSHVYVSYFIAK